MPINSAINQPEIIIPTTYGTRENFSPLNLINSAGFALDINRKTRLGISTSPTSVIISPYIRFQLCTR
jgi:hypothetical protein